MRAILDSPHWMNALLPNGLEGGTPKGGRLASPLRDIIENMPEEAAHVFGKCISGPDHASNDREDFEVIETLTDGVDTICTLISFFYISGSDRLHTSPTPYCVVGDHKAANVGDFRAGLN